MKNHTGRCLVFVIALVAAQSVLAAKEYFADANNGNDAYDGLAEVWDGTHGPKRTVQAAVDVAQAGSTAANRNTVTLLPGDYDSGLTAVTKDSVVTSNRVVISSPILLRSKNGRSSRDTTRIIGAWDLSGASDTVAYMGPRAVRCVWVKQAAIDGTRLEGLTFLRGASAWGGDGGDHARATGGGGVLFDEYANTKGLVIDCAFVDCLATRGGGVFNATLVRCFFTICRASLFGCAARQCNAYNCVFADSLRCPTRADLNAHALSYPYTVVNCTFVGNMNLGIHTPTTSSGTKQKVYNCLFFRNGGGDVSSEFTPVDCVSDVKGDGRTLAITNEVFSPASGDYRLTAGAASTTAGNAEWLEKIPEEFRSTDYFGNPRTTGGRVYAGAAQVTAKPAGGLFWVNAQSPFDNVGKLSCNDHVCARLLYEQGEKWPRLVKFGWESGVASGGTNRVIRFCNGDWKPFQSLWPMQDDTAWTLAPASGESNLYYQYGLKVYVDPVSGSDTDGDGTREKPWRTLQKAVDGRNNTGDRVVVHALPGDYCEGAVAYLGCSNRVHVTSPQPLRVISTEGAERTFITGAPDTVTPMDNKGWGIGSNAVRCVSIGEYATCAFQGFTLRGGRGSQVAGNKDADAARGAGFLNGIGAKNYNCGFLLDSVVTDCRGSRGPAAYGGICERTVFNDCDAHGLGAFRYTKLRSCVVTNCPSATGVFSDISYAWNTTFYGNKNTAISHAFVYNCVSAGNGINIFRQSNTTNSHSASVFATVPANYVLATDSVKEDPFFADATGGDLRLVSGSAGTWLGKAENLASGVDFNGRPFTINAEGRTRAGAFDTLVPGVRIERGLGDEKTIEVKRVTEDGLTVTGTPSCGRSCIALAINGVTQAVGTVSRTISLAEATSVVPFVVGCVYPNQFYVDAVQGSDANDGLSETTAWKTLAKASTNAPYAGDRVLVLPGTYDEGEVTVRYASTQIDTTPIGTRVQVFPGVTFESRDGAESTVILGARGTGTVENVNIDARGCGPGAVKCAFVGDNAVLRGFTLRGGRGDTGWIEIYGNKDRQGSANMGAGVMGTKTSGAGCNEIIASRRVENCVIDDCVAPRGGAGRWVGFYNCVITGCGGDNMGAVVRDATLAGCVIAKTLKLGSEQFYNVILDGCTILADNLAFSHTFDKTAFPSGLPTLNTAFARVCWLGSLVYSNCAFAAGTTFTKSSDALFANVNPVLGVTDFKIDDEGRPDRDSPLVDAGDASLVASAERPAADRMLTPRVLNGAIDIGAYEYDWRKDFSKTLARRRLTVTEVTPGATLVDNALVWSDGEMALEWARGGGELPYTFTLSVGAGGSLAVTLNGAPLGTYGEGTQTVRFSSTEALNQMRFIASGEASVRAFDHRSGLLLLVR